MPWGPCFQETLYPQTSHPFPPLFDQSFKGIPTPDLPGDSGVAIRNGGGRLELEVGWRDTLSVSQTTRPLGEAAGVSPESRLALHQKEPHLHRHPLPWKWAAPQVHLRVLPVCMLECVCHTARCAAAGSPPENLHGALLPCLQESSACSSYSRLGRAHGRARHRRAWHGGSGTCSSLPRQLACKGKAGWVTKIH